MSTYRPTRPTRDMSNEGYRQSDETFVRVLHVKRVSQLDSGLAKLEKTIQNLAEIEVGNTAVDMAKHFVSRRAPAVTVPTDQYTKEVQHIGEKLATQPETGALNPDASREIIDEIYRQNPTPTFVLPTDKEIA